MRSSLRVARWEFVQNLKNRQFLLFTIIFPLILFGIMTLSMLLGASEIRQALSAVDQEGFKPENLSIDIKAGISLGIAMAFAFLFLFVAMFSGTLVLQDIVKEKRSRTVEILLSSISPVELMTGKILGFGLLGLVQAAIWVLVGLTILLLVGPYIGLPVPIILAGLLPFIPWGKLFLYLLYFILGYLMLAGMSAGMGATLTDVMSGQQLQSLIIVFPPILPFMLFGLILKEPHSLMALIFSFIPPFTPGMMMIRTAAAMQPNMAAVPAWEIIATLAVLAFSIFIVTRIAGRIFEIGILMYGKSASLREIWRWARR